MTTAQTLSPRTYGRLSIGMHWLMVLLIAATYASIELREIFPRGTDARSLMKTLHFSLGLSIFFLVWLRLLGRWIAPAPRDPHAPAWEVGLAKLAHLALYGLMIGMPLLGWLILSAEGDPVRFFGLELPALMPPSERWEDRFEELHEGLGVAGYWLIGVHAAAALFHHYIRRDDVLRRMLPGRRWSESPRINR